MRRYLLLILLLLVGCQKHDKKNAQELRLNCGTEPPTLDPRKAIDSTSVSLLKMCFEGLTTLNHQGETELAVAERVESDKDQKNFTFYLRESLWSDGKPVTARDFERTWKTVLSPDFPSEFAHELYVLKNGKAAKTGSCPLEDVGVKALSDRVLQVTLEYPTTYFLKLAATHYFLPAPAHIVECFPSWADEIPQHYICNGPFKMVKWNHRAELVAEKNPLYWDAQRVRLNRIFMYIIEDPNTELHLYEQGEIDWAGSPLSALPIDALPSLRKQSDFISHPIVAIYYYIFNTKLVPFNNARIRRAFTLAINRQEVVENILQGGQVPAMGLIPPMGKRSSLPYFQDASLEEARALFAQGLRELGLEKLPEITLVYNTTEGHHKIAQAIQQQWKEAFGVTVRLANKEWKIFLDDLKNQQFQVARMGKVADVNDPSTFLHIFKYPAGNGNFSSWHHPLFTELVEQADLCTDVAMRDELLKKAEALFIEEMPIAPIYFYTQSYLKKPNLKGVAISELGDLDLKTAEKMR